MHMPHTSRHQRFNCLPQKIQKEKMERLPKTAIEKQLNFGGKEN